MDRDRQPGQQLTNDPEGCLEPSGSTLAYIIVFIAILITAACACYHNPIPMW